MDDMDNSTENKNLNQLEKDLYLFNQGEYFDSYHTFGNKRMEGGVRLQFGHQMLEK